MRISFQMFLATGILLLGTGCSGLGGVLLQWAMAPRTHIVAVIDAPDSMKPQCGAVMHMIERTIKLNARTISNIRTGSRLVILRTRPVVTGIEPEFVFDEALPGPQLVGSWERAVEAFLRDARNACEKLPQGQRSPLAQAITAGISHLRRIDCHPNAGCVLIVHADVREGAGALPVPAKRRTAFNNNGLLVLFCGFTGGISDGKGAESLVLGWRKQFSEPERVFPICAEAP